MQKKNESVLMVLCDYLPAKEPSGNTDFVIFALRKLRHSASAEICISQLLILSPSTC